MLKAAFHWGREKDRSEWECAAKMGLLSPISHHCKQHINLWTNQQEGREMLCDGSSFNSTLLLHASSQHKPLIAWTIQYKLAPGAQDSCFLCNKNVCAEQIIDCTTQEAVKWITFQFGTVHCSVQLQAALTNCLENQQCKIRKQRQQKLKEQSRTQQVCDILHCACTDIHLMTNWI